MVDFSQDAQDLFKPNRCEDCEDCINPGQVCIHDKLAELIADSEELGRWTHLVVRRFFMFDFGDIDDETMQSNEESFRDLKDVVLGVYSHLWHPPIAVHRYPDKEKGWCNRACPFYVTLLETLDDAAQLAEKEGQL